MSKAQPMDPDKRRVFYTMQRGILTRRGGPYRHTARQARRAWHKEMRAQDDYEPVDVGIPEAEQAKGRPTSPAAPAQGRQLMRAPWHGRSRISVRVYQAPAAGAQVVTARQPDAPPAGGRSAAAACAAPGWPAGHAAGKRLGGMSNVNGGDPLGMTREESVRTIKALPTMYDGTLYRSRTEARWAVFFDRLFMRPAFFYETQGFLVRQKGYLPDFLLPGQRLFGEVKPAIDADPDGVQKLRDLVAGHGGMRGAVLPEINSGEVRVLLIGPDHGATWEDDNAAWMTCPEGYHHDIQPYFPEPGCRDCGVNGGYWHESDAITAAYTAARSCRFSMP